MIQIKVLQLIDSLNIGGAEMMAVNIANGLSESGIETHFCVTRKEGALKVNLNSNIRYLFLNRKNIIDIPAILSLKKYISKNNINIIHAHSTSSFIAFCVKLIYPKIKIIWQNHTGNYINLKGFKLWSLKLFSLRFYANINVNKDLNKWSQEQLKRQNSILISNFPKFICNDKITFLKGQKDKRIVCVAGFREEKDHLTLLRAFSKFLKTHINWSLHLIGRDYQDACSVQIKDYIAQNNLEANVFMYGCVRDIKNILNQSTVGVLSSKAEGLPVSLLEYGLMRLPVICTDVGECPQVIKHNYSGFVVSPNNHIALASYLLKLAASTELRSKFGENLNINVINNYSEKAVINHIIKIYKSCLRIQNI